jgi:hypothetical protein
MPCRFDCSYMNNLSVCYFLGVSVQQTQLTRTFITQRNDSCMIVLNCCIVNCDELHVKSCHEYCMHLSVNVARQGAGDLFLYMRLEKPVCNAMSHDLLLGLAAASFAHSIISTHSSDLFFIFRVRFEELTYLVRRLFLSNSRRHCLFFDSAR